MHLVESPFKRTCSIFKSWTNQQLIKGFKGTIEGKSYQECTFKSGEFDDEDIDDDVEEEEDGETPLQWFMMLRRRRRMLRPPTPALQWFMGLTELDLRGNRDSNTLSLHPDTPSHTYTHTINTQCQL